MHLLSAVLFAFSSNIDNLTVGIAYGIKKTKIQLSGNILIAIITSIGTFLSMTVGRLITSIISVRVANSLGSIILVAIGLWFIFDFIRNERKNYNKSINTESSELLGYKKIMESPEIADVDHSGYIDVKEAVSLALALTINNLGTGVAASITGINIPLAVAATFIFSIVTLEVGGIIGNSAFSKIFGKYTNFVSGVIIVILGVYEMFI
jgi:putative sporulation protein YtaF